MEKEEEILQKAKMLFMTYGLRSITMDDLARELCVSKKTLYQFFKDKADLIEKIVKSEIDMMLKKMQKIYDQSENTIDRMIKINLHMIEMRKSTPKNVQYDLEKYYPEIAEKSKKETDKKMFEAIKENHERGKKEGLIREDLNTDIIASLQINRSKYINKMIEELNNYDDEKILNDIFEYHIRGIATEKGINYYQNKFNKNK